LGRRRFGPVLWLLVWTGLFCVAAAPGARAAVPTVEVGSDPGELLLTHAAQLLEDAGRRLTVETARRADGWRPAHGQALSLGISPSAWWVRLRLHNATDQARECVLDTGSTQQDYIDWNVFTIEGTRVAHGRMGDRLPFRARPLNSRSLALPLHFEPGQTLDVYLRLDTHDGLFEILPLALSGREAFFAKSRNENVLLSLFHGGVLVLIVFSLSLLIFIYDTSLVLYTLYLLSFLLYSCVASGFDLLYFWPDTPLAHNILTLAATSLCFLLANGLAINLLKPQQYIPRWLWWVMRGLIVLILVGMIPLAFDQYALAFDCTVIGVVLTLLHFGVAVWLSLRGVRGAGLLCAAFAALIVGVCLYYLQLLMVINVSPLTIGAMQLGSCIQIMAFAVILALSLRQLAMEKTQAEAASQAKAAFLATMSHEIRTPMNAILGFARLSLRHAREPHQRDRIEKILRAGQHLLSIINDILDFSKIDGGYIRLEHIPFAPSDLLEQVRDMLEDKAVAKGLTLVTEADPGLPAVLSGDPLRISQIALNYVNNAIKFSEIGTIRVCLRLERGKAGLLFLVGEVSDQGIGIPEERLDQLFKPFQQLDASISRRYGGTGLGLAICKELAEKMGGGVGVRSRAGAGSQFWFRVRVEPAAPGAVPQPLTVPAAATPSWDWESLVGRRVLLVEDDALNQLIGRELLETAGMEVDMAEDGEQAIARLEAAADGTYAAVLMDMMLPVLDGVSATRRLRRNPRFATLPIIAMTANTSPEDIRYCEEAGMNAHIAKPLDEAMLWQTLSRFLPPAVAKEGAPARPDLFDPAVLEQLREVAHTERFAAVVRLLLADCARCCRVIDEAADRGDATALSRAIHDLISCAGNAGLTRVVGLAPSLREANRSGDLERARELSGRLQTMFADARRQVLAYFHLDATEAAPDEAPPPAGP